MLAHLGLRELHLCAHLSAAWRVQANARRNALRLLQHESAYGVRGNSRDKLHNAGSLALVGGGAALLVSEEKRVRLLRPLGAGESESFESESESAIRGGVAATVRLWQPGFAALVPNHRGSSGPSGLATRLNPRNVVLDVQPQPYYPDLIIYVSDSGTDRVHMLRRSIMGGGSESTALGSVWPFGSVGCYGTADGELISPGALALGEADAPLLFVSEGDRVSCFDADSLAFRFHFGRRGEACGEFRSPAGLVVHDGEVLVCDRLNHRVQAFAAADGAFRRAFGRRGTALSSRPESVAVARAAVWASTRTSASRCSRCTACRSATPALLEAYRRACATSRSTRRAARARDELCAGRTAAHVQPGGTSGGAGLVSLFGTVVGVSSGASVCYPVSCGALIMLRHCNLAPRNATVHAAACRRLLPGLTPLTTESPTTHYCPTPSQARPSSRNNKPVRRVSLVVPRAELASRAPV